MCEIFGLPADQVIGRDDTEFFDQAHSLDLKSNDHLVLSQGRTVAVEEIATLRASGEQRIFFTVKSPLRDGAGTICGLCGVSTDITEYKRAQEALARSEEKFRSLFQTSTEAVVLLSSEGRFLEINPAELRLFGAPGPEALLGRECSLVSPERQPDGTPSTLGIAALLARLEEGVALSFEWTQKRLDSGEPLLTQVSFTGLRVGDRLAGLATLHDITERRRHEEELRRLAFEDALTGLPNKAASQRHLQERMSAPDGGRLTIVDLDFDRFQWLNNSFGLDTGDRLLTTTARLLRCWLEPGDWLARIESDEFLVVRSEAGSSETEALAFARRLQVEITSGLAQCGGLPVQPSVSVGVALSPDHGSDPVGLMQCANTALMEAKRSGRGGCRAYSTAITARLRERIEMEHRLDRAIDREQLHLAFQPQVDRGGEPVGAEALLRWRDQEGRMVSPGQFIPLAEETGRIHRLGRWVIEEAFSRLAGWRREGLFLPSVAINLSALQFEERSPSLGECILATRQRHGIEPEAIELEITESALLENPEQAREQLEALAEQGFRVAIDDFGTGYSSLALLHSLPVNRLKIDTSFVRNLVEDPMDRAIVRSTIRMAHDLGLETMAEGVETDRQREILSDLECDGFQGFLFGHPMAADLFSDFLRCRAVSC